MVETKKKKRVSKKNKKAWRKHTNIADVEEFLEDIQLQERIGDASQKSDEALFLWDKSHPNKKSVKRRGKEPKPLRCHQHLEPNLLIKPARLFRRVPLKAGIKKTAQLLAKQKRDLESATKKGDIRPREKAQKLLKRFERMKLTGSRRDLWSSENNSQKPEKLENNAFYLEVTKQKLMEPPKYKDKKPSDVAAVEVLHPGGSYNPTFNDYMELMKAAHEVEKKKVEEEKRTKRQLKTARIYKDELQKARSEEMKSGLFEPDDDENEVKEENTAKCYISKPPVRRENIKTAQKRRREILTKAMIKLKKQEKIKKIRENEIFRLRSIKRELNAQEKKTAERIKKKRNKKMKQRLQTRKLGKHKFDPLEIPILLSHELPQNLRSLKPQGHLLMDRYKSLQKRNIIEPRLRQLKKRRYALKKVETRTHKNITL